MKIKKVGLNLHTAYHTGVLIKAIDGLLESIAGLVLAFSSLQTINYVTFLVTRGELAEDSNDLLANWLATAGHNLSLNSKYFLVAYLVSHGLVKVFLAVGLWRHRRWAYPTAVFFLSFFILAQTIRNLNHFSIILTALTIIDISILIVVVQQWRQETPTKMSSM